MTLNKAYGHAMAFTANVIFGLAVPVTQLLLLHWMTPVGYTFSRVVFASAVFWTVGLFGCKENVKLRDLLLIAVVDFSVSSFHNTYHPFRFPALLTGNDDEMAFSFCHYDAVALRHFRN